MIDLSRLPPPDVVEPLDYEAILAAMLADYKARWPEFTAWVESDPALKLFEAAAYRELLLRARVNDAARSVMLAHAEGADLDNLAAAFALERLAGESDASLRRRATLSLGAHNTAGSAASYEHWALTVPGVVSACARSVNAGEARVIVTGEVSGAGAEALDGQPSGAVLAAVVALFGRADVRPLTDSVVVWGVQIQPYVVTASVTVAAGADRAAVRAAAEASLRAECLRLHHCQPPQNDVSRERLIASLFVAGVEDVSMSAPAADVRVATYRAAWPTTGSAIPYGRNRSGADPIPDPAVRHPMDGITVTLA